MLRQVPGRIMMMMVMMMMIVIALPDTWRYRVSALTGWPGVSTL